MKHIAQRAIVDDHDFTQIWFDRSQVFNVCSVSLSAVLSVEAAAEVLALEFEPIDDWVGVFLHRRREDYQIIPFRYLSAGQQKWKIVAVNDRTATTHLS
jgi:hypothetical protein